MYPIGSNAINDRTIGESAQGLADYVKDYVSHRGGRELSCSIAYDTRHRSRHFAQLCAEVMAAAGFTVCFLDGYRSTPELSFAVRFKQCSCGIMVTASHNPPSDNAVKVYWSTGGQLLPPHDRGVIDCVMSATTIHRTPFDQALTSRRIVLCQDEVDRAYLDAVLAQDVGQPQRRRFSEPAAGLAHQLLRAVRLTSFVFHGRAAGQHAIHAGQFRTKLIRPREFLPRIINFPGQRQLPRPPAPSPILVANQLSFQRLNRPRLLHVRQHLVRLIAATMMLNQQAEGRHVVGKRRETAATDFRRGRGRIALFVQS